MKNKYIYLTIFISLAFFFSGCLYRDVKAPGPVTNMTWYQLTTDDYKVLGTVEASGEIKTYVWLVSLGGIGYSELYEKGKQMGGDEIMNYVFEFEEYNLLFIIYNNFKWKARATVVKYTDKAKAKAAVPAPAP